MAVISFNEIHNGRDGEFTADKKKSARRYIRVFRAITDDNADDAFVIYAHASCPKRSDVHNSDSDAYCRRVTPRNEGYSKRVWIVTALYSSEYELQDDPTDEPADISWGSEPYTEPAVHDIYGEAIVNSAGSKWDPSPEKDASRWAVTIRKNMATVPAWISLFQDAINNANWTVDGITVATQCAKVTRITISEPQERNEVDFRVLTMVVHIRKQRYIRTSGGASGCSGSGQPGTELIGGWKLAIFDNGMMVKDPDDATKRVKATDDDGDEVSEPIMLDGNGNALANPSFDTCVFQSFDVYDIRDFSVLPVT